MGPFLQDADKHLFDAIIVVDASRWSRDNRKSKEGLDVFRNNGIRFFVGTSEYDLFNPEHIFILGMSAEIGEFQARQQTLKSITNRIERAKQGIPSTGRLPYGRKYDRKTKQWSIDTEAQQKIQWAAEHYIAGESLRKIATTLGMNQTHLWKALTIRSGDEWPISFSVKKLNIDETIILKVPSLLPPETIAAIKQKAVGNKTYTHGQLKNLYLLGRVVLCAECGNAMFGQTNQHNRYYRHPRGNKNSCNPGLWIPAEELEQAAIVQLFAMFGNPDILKTAVERATPNDERIEELKKKLISICKNIKTIITKKDRVIDAVAEGLLAKDNIKNKMDKLLIQEEALISEKVKIQSQLDALPHYKRQLSELGKRFKQIAALNCSHDPENLSKMTFDEKRQLVQMAFAGRDINGKRLGVYVKKSNEGQWSYEIRGIIHTTYINTEPACSGELPMTESEAQVILGVDTEYSDFKPLDALSNSVTKNPLHRGWSLPRRSAAAR